MNTPIQNLTHWVSRASNLFKTNKSRPVQQPIKYAQPFELKHSQWPTPPSNVPIPPADQYPNDRDVHHQPEGARLQPQQLQLCQPVDIYNYNGTSPEQPFVHLDPLCRQRLIQQTRAAQYRAEQVRNKLRPGRRGLSPHLPRLRHNNESFNTE